MARLKWLEPKELHPSYTPSNFHMLEERRRPFGQNGAARCVALSRSTGARCKNPAVTGACSCRVHGGLRIALKRARERDPEAKLYVSPQQAQKRYLASVAFSDEAQTMTICDPNEHVGARGRRIAAALNRDLNR